MHTFILVLLFLVLFLNLLLMLALVIGFFHKVPYVPSSRGQIRKMIDAADIKEGEHIADLGCGDGKILFMAEKYSKGASFTGYEIAPMPIAFFYLKKLFNRSKASLKTMDFMKEDFSKYSVVFLYLLPEVMDKMLPKLEKELPKGARVISNVFTFKNKVPAKVIDADKKMHSVNLYTF